MADRENNFDEFTIGESSNSYDEVHESFDNMSLQENLLPGIYAYGFEKPSRQEHRRLHESFDNMGFQNLLRVGIYCGFEEPSAIQQERQERHRALLKKSLHESIDEMVFQENLLRGMYAYGFEKPSPIQQKRHPTLLQGNRRDPVRPIQYGRNRKC